jgi:hypothetical protein
MKTADPTSYKTHQPRLYERPKVRVVRPKLDSSVTTTINSSSPNAKRPQEKV